MKLARRATLAALAIALTVLAPAALADEVKSEARIKNKEPVLESVALGVPDADAGRAGHQVGPSPGAPRAVEVIARASDGNGWKDLAGGSFRILGADGAAIGSGSLVRDGDGRGRLVDLRGSWSMPHHQAPGTYTIEADVQDATGASAAATTTFDVVETLAMALGTSALRFGDADGALEPGSSSHGAPAQVTVRNVGNVVIDLGLSATDLRAQGYDAAIPASSLHYSLEPDMAAESPLAGSLTTAPGFDLAPGESSTRQVYFALHVPTGDERYLPATTYQGTIALSAAVNS